MPVFLLTNRGNIWHKKITLDDSFLARWLSSPCQQASALEECTCWHPQITPDSVAIGFTRSDDISYSISVVSSNVEAFLEELENPNSMPSSAYISPSQREFPSQKVIWELCKTVHISDQVLVRVRGGIHGLRSILSPCAKAYWRERGIRFDPRSTSASYPFTASSRLLTQSRKKLSAWCGFMLWICKILQGT